MSIFENMNAREIAMCLSAFYYAAKKYTHAQLYDTQVYLPNREKPISIDRSDYDEGIKILRDDYDVFWTPDTKPDDLKWKINKRWMKELQDRFAANSWYGASSGVAFGPGCVVTGNDYLYRRELGLPDNATVADILERIRELKHENSKLNDDVDYLKENLGVTEHALKAVKQDRQKLEEAVTGNDYLYRRELGLPDNATVADICKKIRRLMNESCVLNSKVLKLEDADRLRRHWHSKYEEEHKECVRLSKLHAADKEKKDKQDATIRDLGNQNTTLEYSVAALKKRIRNMEAEAQEKEAKNKVIIDTLRDNLADSVEECKRLNGRIYDLEALVANLTHDDDVDDE